MSPKTPASSPLPRPYILPGGIIETTLGPTSILRRIDSSFCSFASSMQRTESRVSSIEFERSTAILLTENTNREHEVFSGHLVSDGNLLTYPSDSDHRVGCATMARYWNPLCLRLVVALLIIHKASSAREGSFIGKVLQWSLHREHGRHKRPKPKLKTCIILRLQRGRAS